MSLKSIAVILLGLALGTPGLAYGQSGEKAFHRLFDAHDSEILEILNAQDVTYACFPENAQDRFFLFDWSKPSPPYKLSTSGRREVEGLVALYRYENSIRVESDLIRGTWSWTPAEGGPRPSSESTAWEPTASFSGNGQLQFGTIHVGDECKYPDCSFRLDASQLSFSESYENKAKEKVVHRIDMRLSVGLFHESWDEEKAPESRLESNGRCERYNRGVKDAR